MRQMRCHQKVLDKTKILVPNFVGNEGGWERCDCSKMAGRSYFLWHMVPHVPFRPGRQLQWRVAGDLCVSRDRCVLQWGPPLVVNQPFFFEKMKERKREVRSGRKKEHYIEKERGRVCVCVRAWVHIEIICLLGHMAQPDLLPFSLIIPVKTSVFNVSSFVAKMRQCNLNFCSVFVIAIIPLCPILSKWVQNSN